MGRFTGVCPSRLGRSEIPGARDNPQYPHSLRPADGEGGMYVHHTHNTYTDQQVPTNMYPLEDTHSDNQTHVHTWAHEYI